MGFHSNEVGRFLAVLLLAGVAVATSRAARDGDLEKAFAHPPAEARPWTYWWWLNGAASAEGINDVPMGEFWKRNREPDGPITHRHNASRKQAASAAHIYDTMAHAVYGCPTCAERKKTGKPAALLPAGLLGPVRIMQTEG